jgi:hypothetical protein
MFSTKLIKAVNRKAKYLAIGIIGSMCFLNGLSQEKIIVKPGKSIQDYFSKEETFLYPEFLEGNVILRDGKSHRTRLNYNILLGQMLFIQSKDTLAISNPNDLLVIELKSDTFYYANGYHQLLKMGFGRYLTKKQYVKYDDVRKGGAFGTTSSLSATTTMSSYTGRGHQTVNLVANQEFVVSKRCEFYIADSKKNYRILNKSTLKKLYPLHKEIIEKYILD